MEQKHDLQQFMKELVEELEKGKDISERYDVSVDYGNESIKFTKKEKRDDASIICVSNLYSSYTHGERIEHLTDLLKKSMFGQVPDEVSYTWDELKSRVYPQLKATEDIGSPILSKVFCGDVSVAYVVDFDDRMMYITDMMFERWNISMEDIHNKSLENLKKITPSSPKKLGVKQDPVFGYYSDDDYTASRILVTDIYKLKQKFRGRICMIIPNRGCTVIFDEKTPSLERIKLQAHRDYHSYPYPISKDVFVWDNGEWNLL